MNRLVRIGERQGGEILENYCPAVIKWSEDSRVHWQTAIDTNSYNDFSIFLEIGYFDESSNFIVNTGWWFSYQCYAEFEFEDGTIKVFKTKNENTCFSDEPEKFKEMVEFIDDYVNNGYELTDKTAVVLDDEDDLFVV